jgi:serine/threonine protein kinase
MKFRVGEQIPLENGQTAKILREIGDGGQGTVYQVRVQNKDFALKWYKNVVDKNISKENLAKIIQLGDIAEQFIMPKWITREIDGQFGSVMDLLPSSFASFPDYLNQKIRFASIEKQILAGINLVNAFRSLHRKGYNYKDLNDGNFFMDTQTGDVRIIDNDNISAENHAHGVQGKPGYMAPEVVTGKAPPSAQTDRHSLAVILFKLFIKHDPLRGKRYYQYDIMGPQEQIEHFGKHPVFIFDPNDASNRPKEGVDINPLTLWPLFPQFFQDIFIKTFVQGIKNPDTRISDDTWQKTLVQLRDEISICPECGQEFLWSIGRCDSDHTRAEKPKRLKIKSYSIPLFPKQKLYACHINAGGGDYRLVIGEVQAKKNNPDQLAVKNLSKDVWTYRLITGETKEVKKNELIPLTEGIESIVFNKSHTGLIGDVPEAALYLLVEQYQVPLFGGQKLRGCHTRKGSETEITGEIKARKDNKRSLALVNLSGDEWIIASKSAKRHLKKGEIVPLRDGLRVTFTNGILGKIKVLKIEGE